MAIVGCGLIGGKRAAALRPHDRLVGAVDVDPARSRALVAVHGGTACESFGELLSLVPDVVVIATPHDQLAPLSERALGAGAHVLVEKPAALGVQQVDRLRQAAGSAGRLVKVGFNHRFHPALAQLAAEVHSGAHGELMHLRARYGHGGRTGYDREWRADPRRSGGGELIDQGMHLLDLCNWIAGPLPLHSALLRTHFWDTAVEDNAALILGERDRRASPWAMLHVTWTEWKNLFSLEVYCQTAKLEVDGLVRSYGSQRLLIYRMRPELGPPDIEERRFGSADVSWTTEWTHFAEKLEGAPGQIRGDLDDARAAWAQVEAAYASSPPYAALLAAPAADG